MVVEGILKLCDSQNMSDSTVVIVCSAEFSNIVPVHGIPLCNSVKCKQLTYKAIVVFNSAGLWCHVTYASMTPGGRKTMVGLAQQLSAATTRWSDVLKPVAISTHTILQTARLSLHVSSSITAACSVLATHRCRDAAAEKVARLEAKLQALQQRGAQQQQAVQQLQSQLQVSHHHAVTIRTCWAVLHLASSS